MHQLYAQSHGPELEAELMRRHEPLAVQLAKRFAGRGEATDDLCQVARHAMLRALRTYEPHRGTLFSTYAVPTILGALKRQFRDRGWLVRPPRPVQESYLAVCEAREALQARLGRFPTATEIAGHLGLAVEDVLESEKAGGGRRAVSLEGTTQPHDDGPVEAVTSDRGAQMMAAEHCSAVGEWVRALPEAERDVIVMSFFWDLSQGQVAALLGISQSTVSRVRRRALERLRRLHRQEVDAA
jgi:RNA polymerase sigma-B factor